MVNYFKQILSLIVCLTLLSACQEGSDAGDLTGQWKMSGTDTRYIAFSGSVTVFRSISEGALVNQTYGNFQHVGDSLFIQCYSEKGEKADTIMIEESFGFKPINNIRLKITAIDSDQLILSQGSRTWSFTKY